jgi:hypothetical protein
MTNIVNQKSRRNTKMKLTSEDKKLLIKWGFPESDFAQIEEAFAKTKTSYELLSDDEKNDDKKISREEALEILGRETYLSGIGRSAFHCTSVRENEKGQKVYFNSRKLFE